MKQILSLILILSIVIAPMQCIVLARGVDKIEYGKDGCKTVYVSSEKLDDFLNKISTSEDFDKCVETARTLKFKDVLTTFAPYGLPILAALGSYKSIKSINSQIFEPNKVKAEIQKSGKSSYLMKSALILFSEIILSGLGVALSFILGFHINTKNNLLSQLSKCDDLKAEYECMYKSFYPDYSNMEGMPAFLDLTMKQDQRKIRLMRANGMKATLNGRNCGMGSVEPQSWDEPPIENLLPDSDSNK